MGSGDPVNWPAMQPTLAVSLAFSAASGTFLFVGQGVDPWPFLGQRSRILEKLRAR